VGPPGLEPGTSRALRLLYSIACKAHAPQRVGAPPAGPRALKPPIPALIRAFPSKSRLRSGVTLVEEDGLRVKKRLKTGG